MGINTKVMEMGLINATNITQLTGTGVMQNCKDSFIEQCMGFCSSFTPLMSVFIVVLFIVSLVRMGAESLFTEENAKLLREKWQWSFMVDGWMTAFKDIVLTNISTTQFILSLILSYNVISSYIV